MANPENICALFTPNHIHNAAPPHTSKRLLHAGTPLLSVPSTLLDLEVLCSNILDGLLVDTKAQTHFETLPHKPDPKHKWSHSDTRFLLHDGAVYVPNNGDLQTCILKACHDHLLTGHPGQTKTLELICQDYFWPKMHDDSSSPASPVDVRRPTDTSHMVCCNNCPSLNVHGTPCLWILSSSYPLHLDTLPSWSSWTA